MAGMVIHIEYTHKQPHIDTYAHTHAHTHQIGNNSMYHRIAYSTNLLFDAARFITASL